jgi:heptosyltransferase-2
MAHNSKTLIIGPAWVGDMVMAHTLVQRLHNQDPTIAITMVAPPGSAPVAERMAEVQQVLRLPVAKGAFGWQERKMLAQQLALEGFGRAFVLPNSWKSALIPWLAHIPKRIGWRGEWRYGLLNDVRVLDKARYPLMIQRFMALAEPPSATIPSLSETQSVWPILKVDPMNRDQALTRFGLELKKPIIALCPGAEYGPAKRWPTRHFAVLAKQFQLEGKQVWIFGGPKEKELADDIHHHLGDASCINLCGQTSLLDAIDLMSLCELVVTNDSGLMHIAASLSRPTVAIYGSSSPKFTPPLSLNTKILSLNLDCSPCFERVCPLGHTRCLNDLFPEIVKSSCNLLLEAMPACTQ